ncbi:ribosomal biogenesis protein LAS1L [Temnothorax curvispinosus]|uniref:Ribosomal biogenesis protein LAS1L n=1 Tax=Temnothorax curvispinosus TaxID=300111 RepID=A0A6J1PM62_9HYME|nr:ribosomal biogenesis protein LAS1L [Temnothorax curvispinosus]
MPSMVLSGKHDGIKQVPWLSPAEWHDVYRQIYSNDPVEQAKAYEALLAWKARMPKLPVGVDCTLSILQVCLRDREWTSKIDSGELPMYCENDLSLMYSTTIMRFLNHFSNIGHTKQTSMFKIASQLKIPEWIVKLRHETAHGYELPSIGVLRIAINILLHWLHDEYWAPEARTMEKCYVKKTDASEEEEESEAQDFTDVIELWTAVGLYVNAGYNVVSDLPEIQLREILQDLRTYMLTQYRNKTSNNDENEYISVHKRTIKIDKEYNLQTAQALLLSKISVDLNESSGTMQEKSDAICNALCKNEAFLPNLDIMRIFQRKEKKNTNLKRRILPPAILLFWKDIIFLLHEKEMLETLLFKLLNIVDQERETKERRTLAALWISSTFYSFVQLNIVQDISRTMEYHVQKAERKLDTKTLSQRLKERIHSKHPYLRNVLWLDISSTIPHFLLDIKFLSSLLLNVNDVSARLIEPILKLLTSKIGAQTKRHLLNLLQIYTFQKHDSEDDSNNDVDKIFSVQDLNPSPTENEVQMDKIKRATKKKTAPLLADQIIRNSHWKSAHDTYQWIGCPIGLLPWQVDSLKSMEPLKLNPSRHSVSVLDSQIVAGIINRKNLKMQSRIKWDEVLRKKRRIEKKRNTGVVDVIMNRALERAKNQT